MKALSVNQPWAWLIVHGGKWIENRTWRTTYRGPLAIHAGLSRRWLEDWYLPDGRPAVVSRRFSWALPPTDELVFGAVIGLVELVDCLRYDHPRVRGNYWNDEAGWCWVLRNPRAVEPAVACRGHLKLFEVELNAAYNHGDTETRTR
jgi:hypothetical protein